MMCQCWRRISTATRPLVASHQLILTSRVLHTSSVQWKKTAEAKKYTETPSLLQRLKQKFFREGAAVSKVTLYNSGYSLAAVATHNVDVAAWFRVFDMPDTFFSWFLVTELHVWMLSTRINVGSDKTDSERLRNFMVEALWDDLERRSKQIPMSNSMRKNQIWDLAEEFQTALIVYDIGALGDDMALANAVWKRFFLADDDADPQKIELLVKYVRKTLAYLDTVNHNDLFEAKLHQDTNLKWFSIDQVAKE